MKIRKNGLGVKKGTKIEIAGFLVLYFRNFRVVYCFFRNFLERVFGPVWNDPKNPFSAGFGQKFDPLGLPEGRFFPKFEVPFSRVPFDQPPRAEKRTPKSPKSTIFLKSEKGVFQPLFLDKCCFLTRFVTVGKIVGSSTPKIVFDSF